MHTLSLLLLLSTHLYVCGFSPELFFEVDGMSCVISTVGFSIVSYVDEYVVCFLHLTVGYYFMNILL